MKKCAICGGKTEHKHIDLPLELRNKFLVVKNVPAEVCTQCGEIYYSVDVAKKLEKIEAKVSKNAMKIARLKNAYEVALPS